MLTDHAHVRRVPLARAVECRDVVSRLDGIRHRWTRRGGEFYTLGPATYLDVCAGGSVSTYRALAAASNDLVWHTFGDVLERTRATLSALTGATCEFDPDLALPGFHIFLAASLRAEARDALHLDLQYRYLVDAAVDAEIMTFTLPVELPLGGAGIELCRLEPADKRGRLGIEEYRLGELLVHSGRTLHRRAPFPAGPSCRRITIQGHGVKKAGRWMLYW